MSYTVASETFESLANTWDHILAHCPSNTPFLSLPWQRLWWHAFRDDNQALTLGISTSGRLVGIASLVMRDQEVSFMGSTEVCDYQDFILPAEHSRGGIDAVMDYLEATAWNKMVLHSISGSSPTIPSLEAIADKRGYRLTTEQEDVCPRAELPSDWESYLGMLSKKDRHELRRKLRRLEQNGELRFYASEGHDLDQDLDVFFRLHRVSREEKAAFMTEDMAAFFRRMVHELLPVGVAKLFFLDLDGVRTASALCFDYAGQRLLYNSGYDIKYASLSVGLLLKAFIIKDALEAGMSRFDFLRGNEPYKYDLGGVDHPIYTCTIERE